MSADLTLNQALGVWSELEAAYYGKNGFGGDTAEIYAYRLQPYRPGVELPNTQLGAEAIAEQAMIAGENLYWLLGKFCEHHGCTAIVDGTEAEWLRGGFEHRVHVRIFHKEPR